jgi:predicted ATPase
MAGLHRMGWQWQVPLLLVELALVLRACGDADAATETAREALQVARVSGELAWEAEAIRVMGEVKLANGRADAVEVEADLRAAIDVAERQGAKAFQLRAAVSLARLWAGQGSGGRAATCLPRSTAGSPRASAPRTCGRHGNCSTSSGAMPEDSPKEFLGSFIPP